MTGGLTDGCDAATGLGARPASAAVADGVAEGFAQAGRAAAVAAGRRAVPVAELTRCRSNHRSIIRASNRKRSHPQPSFPFSVPLRAKRNF